MIAILIFLGVLLFHLKTVNFGFLIDDDALVDISKAFPKPITNPIMLVWKYMRGRYCTSSKLAHSVNITVHALVSMMIYFVFGRTNIALLAALLFGFNPVTTQCSTWSSGKPYAIATLLILIGFLFKEIFPVMFLAAYTFSFNIVLAPIAFLWLKPIWLVCYIPLVFLISQGQAGGFKTRFNTVTPFMKEISPRKLIIAFKSYGYYFTHGIFPLKISMCHSYLHTFGITKEETEPWYKPDRFFFLGVVLFVATIGLTLFHFNQTVFGLLMFSVLMAQWSNFIYLNHPITERYAYLANVFLMYMLANILLSIPYGTYLALAFLIFYATRTWYVMDQYKDKETFWRSNAIIFPNVALAYNQWGLDLMHQGKLGTACDVFIAGTKQRLTDFRLNYNLAHLLMSVGDFVQAKKYALMAQSSVNQNSPENVETWKTQVTNMIKFIEDKLPKEVPVAVATT